VCFSAAVAATRCAPPRLNATRPSRSATMRRGRSSARASSHPECPSASRIAVCFAGSCALRRRVHARCETSWSRAVGSGHLGAGMRGRHDVRLGLHSSIPPIDCRSHR